MRSIELQKQIQLLLGYRKRAWIKCPLILFLLFLVLLWCLKDVICWCKGHAKMSFYLWLILPLQFYYKILSCLQKEEINLQMHQWSGLIDYPKALLMSKLTYSLFQTCIYFRKDLITDDCFNFDLPCSSWIADLPLLHVSLFFLLLSFNLWACLNRRGLHLDSKQQVHTKYFI